LSGTPTFEDLEVFAMVVEEEMLIEELQTLRVS
jgi:hypothetical protein